MQAMKSKNISAVEKGPSNTGEPKVSVRNVQHARIFRESVSSLKFLPKQRYASANVTGEAGKMQGIRGFADTPGGEFFHWLHNLFKKLHLY